MALIKIELDYPLEDGMSLTFKAPCDCTAITGLKVYYPQITEDEVTNVNATFSFKDTHLNVLNSLGNLFVTGATVKVVVDTVNNYAFIQNADTNGYLETQFNTKADKSIVITTTLLANGWSSDEPPVQTVTATGITMFSNAIAGLDMSATAEQIEAAGAATLQVTAQSEGTVTVAAINGAPTVDIPIQLMVVG